jgi:hypothetical protein
VSGFAASAQGPQSLGDNSATAPDSYQTPRPTKAKARRLLRRGQISQDAARKHMPGLVIMIGRPRHDYDRTGVLKDDNIEGSTA